MLTRPSRATPDVAEEPKKPRVRPASYDRKVGLVLQGGGALGSYQAGVYEALSSSGYTPDWVAGISIGAINAAIIAGNAPNDRVYPCAASGRRSPLPPCCGQMQPERWRPGNVGQARSWQL